MGMAFGISEDDVATVLNLRLGLQVKVDDLLVDQLFDFLDEGAVESAALHENSLEAQTKAAHDEIERQLRTDEDCVDLISEYRRT